MFSLDEYRARIGCYNNRSCRVKISVCVKLSFELYIALTLSLLNFIAIILLQLSCDIHVHPGPFHIDESLSSDTTCTDTSVSFFSENANLFVSLMHLNIQSLKPKIDIIRGNLSKHLLRYWPILARSSILHFTGAVNTRQKITVHIINVVYSEFPNRSCRSVRSFISTLNCS